MQDDTTYQQLILFAEVSHAKTSVLPDAAKDWLESDLDSGLSSIAFLESLGRAGLLSKMCPVFYPPTKDETSELSLTDWSDSGIASAGGYWTLSTSDWPNDAAVCSLSQVLEAGPAPKYFLSPTAAQGILRRAERRGRALPPALRVALIALAERDRQDQP